MRDPAAIFWVFGFPVDPGRGARHRISRGAPGHAADRGDRRRVRSGHRPRCYEAADTLEVEILDRSGKGADVEAPASSSEPQDAMAALRTGKVDLLIASTPGETGPAVRFHYDPMQPKSQLARVTVDAALLRGLSQTPVITVVDEHTTETGSRYIDFLLPGLIGLNLLGSSMWGIGYAVVDIRKRKLLKRFAVTPMRRSHFLLAFMLSRLLFLAGEVALLLLFGWLVFDVGVRGTLIEVAMVCLVGSLCFTGMAVMIAARPRSTEVAAGWLNFVMMPMWLLSGAFFSYSRFPDFAQPFIKALPLTALNDALRGIMNDGASLLAMPVELAVMAAWGVISFLIALRIFRWQ